MASKDGGERRMLFDIRGRRKNVVKAVYATLALLMGLSLLLFFGPAPLTELFGTGSSSTNAADQLEDQAERIELKLKKEPENPQLLLALTRARIGVGNALAVSNPETGEFVAFSPESRQQIFLASETWSKYLKATDEPNAGGAQLAAQAFFGLAQSARTIGEAEGNVREAAKAQQIVAENRPSLGSLSTLAIYRYYSFDYKGAAQARKEAVKYTGGKSERESLDKQLDEISKRGHEFEKQVAQIEKEAKEAQEKGEGAAINPLAENNPLAGG
jgi:hypothetical protein